MYKKTSLALIFSLVFVLLSGCLFQQPAANSGPGANITAQTSPVIVPSPAPNSSSLGAPDADELVLSDITVTGNDDMGALFSITYPDGKQSYIALKKGESVNLSSGNELELKEIAAGITMSSKAVKVSNNGNISVYSIGEGFQQGNLAIRIVDLLVPSGSARITLEIRGASKSYAPGDSFLVDGVKYTIKNAYLGYSLSAKLVELARENGPSFFVDMGDIKVLQFTQELPSYVKFMSAEIANGNSDDGKVVFYVYGAAGASESDVSRMPEDAFTLSRGESIIYPDFGVITVRDYMFGLTQSEKYADISVNGTSTRLQISQTLKAGSKTLQFRDVTIDSLRGFPRSQYAVFDYKKNGSSTGFELRKVGDSIKLIGGSEGQITEIAAGKTLSAMLVKVKTDGTEGLFGIGDKIVPVRTN